MRVYPSGARVYVVQSQGPQGPKRVTVGRHGVVSASQARRRAALLIARIKAGEAPAPALPAAARGGPTVAALAARYLREHAALRCKPRTAEAYRRTIGKHILPALGGLPLAALGARAGGRAARRAAGDARRRERRGGYAVAHAQPGRGLGHGPGGRQPLPLRAPVTRSESASAS